MNFAINSTIIIQSNYFDENGKILDIGYEAFNVYINLFRFRIHNQDVEYTFVTSIDLLRKEINKYAKYTGMKIKECLRLLEKLQIIKIRNNTRWDRIGEKDTLIIEAIEMPVIENDENYIPVDLPMMQYYLDLGLNERYFLLYCIIAKYTNRTEKKANITIGKISERIGIDKDVVNKMVHELEKNYLLYACKKKSQIHKGYNFEHHICKQYKDLDGFKGMFGMSIERNIKKWEQRKEGVK